MDQLATQTIEDFLGVPLVYPERIYELDAKELAHALKEIRERQDDSSALSEAEAHLIDVAVLIDEAITRCRRCQASAGSPSCARHDAFREWLAEVPHITRMIAGVQTTPEEDC